MSATSGLDPAGVEPLERLHALLVEAVRRRRGTDPHGAPVTVAEIYQELVPYRSVRAAVGLEMNADYEHTLLRLLSGESGLARIEPGAAREQIERELQSPNPNVALYRKFAGCDVWLLPASSPPPPWVVAHLAEEEENGAAAAVPEEVATEEEAGGALAVPSPSAGAGRARQPEQPRTMNTEQEKSSPAPPSRAVAGVAGAAGRCAFCDSGLPAGRSVRYCPFCGADQSQRPCAVCGEPLQQDWAYCIACGEPAAVADA